MTATISFEIECGEETCAYAYGKFCRFMRSSMNGKASCYLFGNVYPQPDDYGWIHRHPDCLKNAKAIEK
jgi:hypothetical protein